MTLGEFGKTMVSTTLSCAKKIGKAIMAADVTHLVKAGILIGTAVVTVAVVVRFLKQKHDVYTNEENKSVVDRSLQLNYSDLRNSRELHPMMHKVQKRLTKDLKPRRCNKIKAKKKMSFGKFMDEYNRKNNIKRTTEYGPVALRDLDRFNSEMEAIEDDNRTRPKYVDNRSLLRFWGNC
jgi:hypothetical protein